ncbi:MAG: 6-phosphogluconolactonase [Cytophagales bacterium]|nr:6-phosphogluconolactonase [Cytophagales bacterium]
MEIHIYKDKQETIREYARFFIDEGNKAIKTKGNFNAVLSGGSSPKAVFELLTTEEFKDQLDWTKVFFFFGDERNVPADHADFNGLMAAKALFEPLNISENQIFYVNTSLAPEEAAKAYMESISKHFAGKNIVFDLIMLGLGDDSHTASLFPYTKVLNEQGLDIKSNYLPEKEIFRITMTAAMINQAKAIGFLVYGENKAAAVKTILNGEPDTQKYPAQLIKPASGICHWFLDEGSASDLKS